MMDSGKLLSLCIATNGISEWVFPVLKSIYSQNICEALFEVVVCDNGNNTDFCGQMEKETEKYSNLIYVKTTAERFYNQIETFKLAKGKFIKFVNHRTVMTDGSIQYLLDFARKYENARPTVFFTNGSLKLGEKRIRVTSFDVFVRKLSYFSSWSGGLALWRQDFAGMPADMNYNSLFPHITVLFHEKLKDEYIVDDNAIFQELPTDDTKKGKYNLFHAFAVEYPSVICDLYRGGFITLDTFLEVKNDILKFLADLYWCFVIKKMKSSYDLSNYKNEISVFYSLGALWLQLIKNLGNCETNVKLDAR